MFELHIGFKIKKRGLKLV